MSGLLEINNFVRADNGVYHRAGQAPHFAYSDGEQSEAQLHDILSKAIDLSSSSNELQAHIVDWPTEYHLSRTRANLLRALNLSGVKRVLELGCGCGAITRYLGEQNGLIVDSIEGSPSRAALAALRCRDLPNVTISIANFNQIEFPQDYYDLVLFVGVTEYAGRFSERETDQEALHDLLALSNRTAKSNGVTLVAIENRLGLKYLMGANEDHYAQPYVGLNNYPQSTGIRTYSRSEWQQQVTAAGFASCNWVYPFPDYKVPTVFVNDNALNDNALNDRDKVNDVLKCIRSRDYTADFNLGNKESALWNGLLQAHTLADHANSFLLLMGNDKAVLETMSDFSIVEYEAPELTYLTAAANTSEDGQGEASGGRDTHRVKEQSQSSQVENLQQQLRLQRRHANDLQQKIDVMTHSRGWRWLNRVRRLFGRPNIT